MPSVRFKGRQRAAVAGILLGVLLTAVTVIGQLATTDGALAAVFAVLTAIVGQWWILVPVMIVDLTATTAVLASIASLLADADGHPR